MKVIRADWAYFRAEKAAAVFSGMRARPEIDPRQATYLDAGLEAITRARNIRPDNPRYLTLAAQLHAWKGHLVAGEEGAPDAELAYYEAAMELLRRASRLDPAHARTWALLAEYKARVGQRDEEWHLAREKALALGGADRKLVDRMLAL